MAYKIGICDDEFYQIKVNELFIKEIANRNKVDIECHGFQTGKQLRDFMESQSLDVVLLDIELKEESGIDIAKWISNRCPQVAIIFVTGHREFAEEAFEVNAVGYLVKPYDINRMENTVKKIIKCLEQDEEDYNIVITDGNIKKKIDRRQIMYIERCSTKSVIKTEQNDYSVYESITSLYERIGEQFIRLNQGIIVNSGLITEIKGNVACLSNGLRVRIGRIYRKDVLLKYFK